MITGKTIFITGASGFVGRNLLEALWQQGANTIHIMARPASDVAYLQDQEVHIHRGTLHEPEFLKQSIPLKCDLVFHVAANTSIWRKQAQEQINDNWHGTKNIVEACLSQGVKRLVHVSSIAAYDCSQGVLNEKREQLGAVSSSSYAFSKYKAEEEVRAGIAKGLDAVIVNPAHVLGPYDRGNWVRMFKMVSENKLPGIPSGKGSFADARQVAQGVLAAAQKGGVGENYILGGPNLTFLELVTHMGRLLDQKVPTSTIPDWLMTVVGFSKEFVANFTNKVPDITPQGVKHATSQATIDDTKAQQELGYTHTPIEALLQDTIDWLRQTQQIK